MCKIFLDDVRQPDEAGSWMHYRIGKLNPIYYEDGWVVARNYNEFVALVSKNYSKITHISFDHDLADEHYELFLRDKDELLKYYKKEKREMTGYDCAKWTKDFYKQKNEELPVIFVHTLNAMGLICILDVFNKEENEK